MEYMSIKKLTTLLIATIVLTIPAIQIKQDIEQTKIHQIEAQEAAAKSEELKLLAEEAYEKEQAKIAADKAAKVKAEALAAEEALRAAEAEKQRVAALEAQKAQEAAENAAPAQPAAPRVAASSGNCESYRSLVAQYDWNVNTMLRIMKAESGCNPVNHNYADAHSTCSGSYGLMQIGCIHGYSAAHLESPQNNIAAAYSIFKSQGYTAWTTY